MARNTAFRKAAMENEAKAQKEKQIQVACDALGDRTFKKISEAAHHFKVPYNTLRCRHLRLAVPLSKAHIKEQLLTVAKEEIV